MPRIAYNFEVCSGVLYFMFCDDFIFAYVKEIGVLKHCESIIVLVNFCKSQIQFIILSYQCFTYMHCLTMWNKGKQAINKKII